MKIFGDQKQQRQWHDYGPTLAAEELAADYQIQVSKETLRQWLVEAKLWRVKPERVDRVHVWRPRRERCGELVQWDTSEHDWLEGRGEKMYLIAMIDDATSRALVRFVRHDSTAENMRLLGSYLERHGRPLEFYTNKASLFCTTPKAVHHRDAPAEQPTQIGRALRELGKRLPHKRKNRFSLRLCRSKLNRPVTRASGQRPTCASLRPSSGTRRAEARRRAESPPHAAACPYGLCRPGGLLYWNWRVTSAVWDWSLSLTADLALRRLSKSPSSVMRARKKSG